MNKRFFTILFILSIAAIIFRALPSNIQQRAQSTVSELTTQREKVNEKTPRYELIGPEDAQAGKQHSRATYTELVENNHSGGEGLVAHAYIQHLSDIQIEDEGKVIAILKDDLEGSRHQKFIVRTSENVTVLISHNIDIANRVKNLREGDSVSFYGEYIWNDKGGVVHWTHRDPRGRHPHGWIKHNNITYQ